MGQDRTTVDVNLVLDRDVLTQDRRAFETGPAAHNRVPAHNARVDPGVVLDLSAFQNDAALETHTVADHDVRTDNNIRTNMTALADLGRRMDHDVAAVDILEVGVSQLLGVLLGEMAQIEAGTGQKVLGLADVHPETFEVKGVQLAVLCNVGKHFLLDRRRFQLVRGPR